MDHTLRCMHEWNGKRRGEEQKRKELPEAAQRHNHIGSPSRCVALHLALALSALHGLNPIAIRRWQQHALITQCQWSPSFLTEKSGDGAGMEEQ